MATPAANAEVGHKSAVGERAEAIEQIEQQQIVAIGEFEVPVDGIGCEIEGGIGLGVGVVDAHPPQLALALSQ